MDTTEFDEMKNFFFEIFEGVPAFLESKPIIYFVSLFIGIIVAGLFFKLLKQGGKSWTL